MSSEDSSVDDRFELPFGGFDPSEWKRAVDMETYIRIMDKKTKK